MLPAGRFYGKTYSDAYNLRGIKAAFQTADDLRMTRTARRCIVELGMSLEDVVKIIQALRSQNFYKSMTTYADHTIWQDVYYA